MPFLDYAGPQAAAAPVAPRPHTHAQVHATVRSVRGSISALAQAGIPAQGPAQVVTVDARYLPKVDGHVELTMWSGQTGASLVGTQYAYIADYAVVDGLLDPTIRVMKPGRSVSITAVVEGDGITVAAVTVDSARLIGVIGCTADFGPTPIAYAWEEPYVLHGSARVPQGLHIRSGDTIAVPLAWRIEHELPNVRTLATGMIHREGDEPGGGLAAEVETALITCEVVPADDIERMLGDFSVTTCARLAAADDGDASGIFADVVRAWRERSGIPVDIAADVPTVELSHRIDIRVKGTIGDSLRAMLRAQDLVAEPTVDGIRICLPAKASFANEEFGLSAQR
jgi:hypothetical protein